jgi:alkylmercury lyase
LHNAYIYFMNDVKQDLTMRLLTALPELELNSSDFVLKMHRELLKGEPVPISLYYEIVNVEPTKADLILEKFGVLNDDGNINAFFGLSLIPTKHKLKVDGHTFYTWCVVDAILFTDWLEITSTIESHDPDDGSFIKIELKGDRLISSSPSPLYVSWVDNIDACNLRDTLCDHVSFFASSKTAGRWSERHPEGRIIKLTDFFGPNKLGMECC